MHQGPRCQRGLTSQIYWSYSTGPKDHNIVRSDLLECCSKCAWEEAEPYNKKLPWVKQGRARCALCPWQNVPAAVLTEPNTNMRRWEHSACFAASFKMHAFHYFLLRYCYWANREKGKDFISESFAGWEFGISCCFSSTPDVELNRSYRSSIKDG